MQSVSQDRTTALQPGQQSEMLQEEREEGEGRGGEKVRKKVKEGRKERRKEKKGRQTCYSHAKE